MPFRPKRSALGQTDLDINVPNTKIKINDYEIEEVQETKFLGVIIDNKLSWLPHVSYLTKKLRCCTGQLNRVKKYLPSSLYKNLYQTLFESHLSILLSGLDGDERRMIDSTMTRLRSLVERTGITLFLVSHLRRSNSDSNSHEEGGRVSLGQLRGSHSISQISDSVIALERDQQSEDSNNSTTLRVLKNRYSGEVGVATRLTYDLASCKFYEANETETTPIFDATTDF